VVKVLLVKISSGIAIAALSMLYTRAGQLVSYELVDATASSCPVELVKVPVPDSDAEFRENCSSSEQSSFPFLRSSYDPRTGNAPNRPRQPVSQSSIYIYTRSEVRVQEGLAVASIARDDPSTLTAMIPRLARTEL